MGYLDSCKGSHGHYQAFVLGRMVRLDGLDKRLGILPV